MPVQGHALECLVLVPAASHCPGLCVSLLGTPDAGGRAVLWASSLSGCCGPPLPLSPPSRCLSPLLWLLKPLVLAWRSATALRLGEGAETPDQPLGGSQRGLHWLARCHLHLCKVLLSRGPSGVSAHKGREAGSLAPRAGTRSCSRCPGGACSGSPRCWLWPQHRLLPRS